MSYDKKLGSKRRCPGFILSAKSLMLQASSEDIICTGHGRQALLQDSMSNMKTIILASASPRRKEILQKTGLKFKVCASDYEEDMDSHSDPHKLARHLSYMKANKAAHKYKNALIIAADTFIVFKGKSLGKPHTGPEARAMLKALNGRAHSVITGFTVMDTRTNNAKSKPT